MPATAAAGIRIMPLDQAQAQPIRARLALAYPGAPRGGCALDVALELPGRGITGIHGRSGAGKTTLLRCLAGLQRARGRLSVHGETWQDAKIFLPPHERSIGYVFQEHNLFPHLTARENLEYARKRAWPGGACIRFDDAVALLGIEALLDRHPHRLSGGECQRVAIARALLINPRLLLMDEPLSALDAARRREILSCLERLRAELAIPVLYVSHSLDEIARLADHLLALDGGRAIADAPLREALTSLDLAAHLDEEACAVLPGRVLSRDGDWDLLRVEFPGGELWVSDAGETVGSPVRLRVPARDVSLALQPGADSSILNILPGRISAITYGGDAMCLARIAVGESALIARVTRRSAMQLRLEPGLKVWTQIKSAAIVR
jgi:molybdate transport system ATP-binding protein